MSNIAVIKTNSATSNFSKLIKKFAFIIPIGVLINLGLTFSSRDKTIFQTITHFSSFYLFIAILLILLPWFANATRLYIWTQFLKTRLSFLQVFKIILISEFGAAITPSAVGSAPVKTSLLIEKKMSPGAALTLATITSLEDLTFFVFSIPIALTLASAWQLPILKNFFTKLSSIMPWVFGIVGLILIVIFLIRKLLKIQTEKMNSNPAKTISLILKAQKKGKAVWKDFRAAYRVIGKKGKIRFITTTLLTGIQWTCRYSIITALLASLGIHTEPILFFVLQWIVFVLSIFIPTPGATGGAEASFYFIFYAFLPANTIGLITAGWRFLSFYTFLGIGVLLYYIFVCLERLTKKSYKPEDLVFAEQ
ncbi:MAG: flippase-like domain-containing protein [bacterium]|nr:flippase-like domain-containing protein [bacterium]